MPEWFGERLAVAVREKGTPAMVGIDPRGDLLPQSIVRRHGLGDGASRRTWSRAIEEFGARVLEVVALRVPIVKFQSAFFEVFGAPGIAALHVLLAKARRLGLLSVLDAKRGDIGGTSEAYAQAAFGGRSAAAPYGADALTVNPYLGRDSLEPFLNYAQVGRGLFVLVRTSNPGSRDLQSLAAGSPARPVLHHIADWVRHWSESTRGASGFGSVGAVVGATAGSEIADLRRALPGTWLLIPGYGAQGAGASDIAAAFDASGLGAIVNNSRGILFPPSRGESAWEEAVAAALDRMIADLAAHTPAGRLAR